MPTVRVTFDDDVFQLMQRNAPASLQDPEVVRFYVSLGMLFTDVRVQGLLDSTGADVGLLSQAQKTAEGDTPATSFRDLAEEKSIAESENGDDLNGDQEEDDADEK